ncbi:MAG TPA: TIGR03013 family PEP-CTERM/XrtA system glycosyltransferase [Pseudomonadales bacterium]|nr:TIGR03013 family PEP-CTERM/XrtA system glycosyltransferase [Pseudomonadales bacterium]HMZ71439.1 TIGR03013 family PEP-CTERM/XrtA system glycosyltransferase [Pseudomonadales bacterium]HND26388.1 TIGR03013 family PEP-CTERM/XrtA system glycosyltransferase [Pseudomonadales bacterium]HNL30910.1 TIGR03013 family PEP-CTERM/XrtA system glycosyltransferase [Pseudomonadales bacterium]
MTTIRIAKHHVHVSYLILFALELLMLAASVLIGAYFRFGEPMLIEEEVAHPLWRALLFALVLMLSMLAMGVYQVRFREGVLGMMLRTASSFMAGGLALSILFYLFPMFFLGRGILALSLGVAFVLLGLLRVAFFGLVDTEAMKSRVLVLGAGVRARNILDRLRRRADRKGFVIHGFVPMEGEVVEVPRTEVLGFAQPLVDYSRAHRIDEIVCAMDDRRRAFPLDALYQCKLAGIAVLDVAAFFEREIGRIELDLLHPSNFIFSDGFDRSAFRAFSKRLCDLLFAVLALPLLLPVMLLARVAIGLEEGFGAPVIYRQQRVGLDDKPFTLYKFRSMHTDAEKHGAQFAQKNDSRITRVGAVIRKYRIDELPQIFNVLKGEMSFVGPRPERPEFVSQFGEEIPHYHSRHRVKPGVTGWAQINYPYGDSAEDARQKLQYDLYYVKNNSLMLDFLILIRTCETVLFGNGAR